MTYLFDFDGTLVDSMPIYIGTMLGILKEQGIPYDEETVKTITPLGVAGTADYFIHTLGVDMTFEQLIDRMKVAMLNAYLHTIPAKEQVISVLQELKAKGNSLNVLTASPHLTLDPCLKRLGIWELFDNVWSCDDFSTTKADPAIYKSVAQRLKTDVDKILFLDDNLDALITAKAAGMKVCGVYDPSSAAFTPQIKKVTDAYIETFFQLLQQ